MFERARKVLRGARLLIDDAVARADRDRRPAVPPFVPTARGPAIGLDGQAYLLGVVPWDSEWSPQKKREMLSDAIALGKKRGSLA